MGIKEFCECVPEIRNEKNLVYKVDEIVFIAFVSVLCGAKTWSEIRMFARSNESYFKNRLPGLVGIPCSETFNSFFSLLDIEWFETCFQLWVDDICRQIPGVVAIDGKAVCKNPKSNGNGVKDRLYMVSAWSLIFAFRF